ARFDLSIRMHEMTAQRVARDEAVLSRDNALRSPAGPPQDFDATPDRSLHGRRSSANGYSEVEQAACLLTTASRPDLLGTVAFDLLTSANVAKRAALLARDAATVAVVHHQNWANVAAEGAEGAEGSITIALGKH